MTVEEAIPIAIEYIKKHFVGTDHRLEEVAIVDDGSFAITISYRVPGGVDAVVPIGPRGFVGRAAIGIDPSRHYRVVSVSKEGRVLSVRIRELVVG